ncbi:MAG TPA: hypothetical protein VNU19_24370 [Candidatus Acidoferrum sp.]|jgi:hypothetical protein|nr:hypothetical protein [Candidatus Acidoferrum sp.]
MNSALNEDLGWWRLEDRQREAENRRLVAGAPSARMVAALRRLAVGLVARVNSDRASTEPVARPGVATRHHA